MYDLRHHAITALLENPHVSEETVEAIAGHISREMKKRYKSRPYGRPPQSCKPARWQYCGSLQ